MTLLLSMLLTAAPLRLVQSVQGVPVGVIELVQERDTITYRAEHVFRGEARRFERSWPVNPKDLESELQVLSRRRLGCFDVREERTQKRERLCVDERGEGSIDDVRIRVTWDGAGSLRSVDVLGVGDSVVSRFERSNAKLDSRVDVFGAGFPVSGAGPVVSLDPRADTKVVAVEGVASRIDASCLPAARAWVAKHEGSSVQLGVVLEAERAWPHAWVRRADGSFVDPTVEREADVLSHRTYVAFSGASLFLELAAGARRVVRSPK